MTRRHRLASVAVVLGLAVAVTTGVAPAGAGVPTSAATTTRPTYPWTAGDPALTEVLYEPGSTTVPFDGQPIKTGDYQADFSNGWTIEFWLKTPTGEHCALNLCPLVGFMVGEASHHYSRAMRVRQAVAGSHGDRADWTFRRWTSSGDGGTDMASGGPGDFGVGKLYEDTWNLVTWSGGPDCQTCKGSIYFNGHAAQGPGTELDIDQLWKSVCILGDRDCSPAGSGDGWNGAYVADVSIKLGRMGVARLTARHDAIESGQVTGPGEPTVPPSPPVPQLACGRTMHDMGGGQWYAEVVAMVRNPPVEGSTYTDHGGSWRTSWDTGQFYGWKQTIALPAGAKPGDGNEATYTMRRDYEVGTEWRLPDSQAGDFTEGNDDYLTADDVVGGPVIGGPILSAIAMVGEWILDSGERTGGGSITAVNDAGEPLPAVPTLGTTVKSVYARCSINVDPVAPEDEGQQQWITINITNNPDDPNPPADGGTADPPTPDDGSGTCGGGSWWNPLTWAKSLFCKLGDILGFLSGFTVDKLPFLDGLEADWRGKFPLSVFDDANGLATGIHDRIDGGINGSPCSTIDPNMDGAVSHPAGVGLDSFRFTLPTPDGSCGENAKTMEAANLMGWRPPLRAFLGIFTWLAFFVRVITSFGPGRTGLEPDPEEAVR